MEYVFPLSQSLNRQRSAWRPIQQFLTTLVVSVFLLATLLSLVNFLQPRGLRLVAIPDNSMGQALSAGSLAVLVPARSYQAGEIIGYRPANGSGVTTHRVVGVSTNGITPTTYQTKGDQATEIDRQRITAGAAFGRVAVAIPYLGYLLAAIQTTAGLMLLVIIPMTLLIGYQLQAVRRRSRENQYQAIVQTGPPLVTRYEA